MNIKTIKTSSGKLNRIIHLADIHIRLYKRQKEYKEVFKELYKDIKNIFQKGDIIVIAGDIHHSKIEMTPESISLISDFFKKLADITDVVIIPGNHDANLNNLKRLDALSPIIKTLNNSKIHYLKNTGLYRLDNVVFSVMGVFEKYDEYIPASNIPDEYVKIALFHGPVQGSYTDTGYKISNKKMNVTFFNGYDIVLLGDIHKRQTLQEYEIESMFIDENELEKYLNYGWKIKKD